MNYYNVEIIEESEIKRSLEQEKIMGGLGGLGGIGGLGPISGNRGQSQQWTVTTQQTSGVNWSWDPSKTNIAYICIQMANLYAFQPKEGQVSDLSELMDQTTTLETSLNSMSGMMTFLMQSGTNPNGISNTGSGSEFQTNLSSFVKSFQNTYMTGGSANPSLSSLQFSVRVQTPTGVQTETISADNPELAPYWQDWSSAAGSTIGPKMFTTDGSTSVSGMQAYMAKYIQTQLDSDPPLTLPADTPLSSDGVGKLLCQDLTKPTGSPLYPSFASTSNLAIQQMWSVLNTMPSLPSNIPSEYGGGKPSNSMLTDLFSTPPNTADLTSNMQYMAWVNYNSASDATCPNASQQAVSNGNIPNSASTWLQTINHAETTVNTTSQTLSQNIQELSSELNVIDNAVAKIIESFASFVQAVVSAYKGT